MAWAIKWRSKDGEPEHLMGKGHQTPQSCFDGYTTMVFKTRRSAREYINDHYGYIRERPDLQREPFGWLMPVPVAVHVEVKE